MSLKKIQAYMKEGLESNKITEDDGKLLVQQIQKDATDAYERASQDMNKVLKNKDIEIAYLKQQVDQLDKQVQQTLKESQRALERAQALEKRLK
jgi:polyhydroxyalkanoate synthesis regulator phasin